ncbi:MAG: histidine phosphatase family protein [Ktedonobacterales bacterium]
MQEQQPSASDVGASVSANGAKPPAPPDGAPSPPRHSAPPARVLMLVRHGQSTYNVENRLPGQLTGVGLTDEGRRQAVRAAVALSGVPVSAVISSPLERAQATAEIIARGWGLPVRTDPRLMDIDVGPWAGQLIADLRQHDPRWEQFVQHPNEPPEGVEGFAGVERRAVAAVDDLLADPSVGSYLVLVAHADVIKLIVAHYSGVPSEGARFISVANASISALAFGDPGQPPHVLAINWTTLPAWLSPPPVQPSPPPHVTETQMPGGAHTVPEQPAAPAAGEQPPETQAAIAPTGV